jgi:hypothetical protein
MGPPLLQIVPTDGSQYKIAWRGKLGLGMGALPNITEQAHMNTTTGRHMWASYSATGCYVCVWLTPFSRQPKS